MANRRPRKRIPRNSPFAVLRDLPRVGPKPIWNDDYWGDDDPVMERLAVVELPDTHPAKRYMGLSQNDANLLSARRSVDQFELTISHYDVGRLACEITDKPIDWRTMRLLFPVTLRFVEVTDLHVVRRIEHGVYQCRRASINSIEHSLCDVIRFECLHWEATVERYVLRLNGRGMPFLRGKMPRFFSTEDDYSILIECKALQVEEHYRDGWSLYFGGKHLDVLDAFENVWPVPQWSMPDFTDWLERYRTGG